MATIPEDIVLDILLRLPVKSIMRFKSVCKGWCTLIESPEFVNRHFGREDNVERLLVRHFKADYDYAFRLYSDVTDCSCEEPDHLQFPFAVQSVLGPLNGVFCLVNTWGQMALLNPATRQFRLIPLACPEIQQNLTICEKLYGFGINPLTGDFKVVSISFLYCAREPHHPSLISVYSSASNSWRFFEDVESVNSSSLKFKSPCNTYLNGVYYWFTECNATDVVILAFDMMSEKFWNIQVPESIRSRGGNLCVYCDSIALLQGDEDSIVDKSVDLWVMKSEGCWIKTLTVGPFPDIIWPICFWRNSELLLETEDPQLHLYNLNTRELRAVEARKKENGLFTYWVFTYKESLVSVKKEGCRCGPWDVYSDLVKSFLNKPSTNS